MLLGVFVERGELRWNPTKIIPKKYFFIGVLIWRIIIHAPLRGAIIATWLLITILRVSGIAVIIMRKSFPGRWRLYGRLGRKIALLPKDFAI
jgi:hypothetical protein